MVLASPSRAATGPFAALALKESSGTSDLSGAAAALSQELSARGRSGPCGRGKGPLQGRVATGRTFWGCSVASGSGWQRRRVLPYPLQPGGVLPRLQEELPGPGLPRCPVTPAGPRTRSSRGLLQTQKFLFRHLFTQLLPRSSPAGAGGRCRPAPSPGRPMGCFPLSSSLSRCPVAPREPGTSEGRPFPAGGRRPARGISGAARRHGGSCCFCCLSARAWAGGAGEGTCAARLGVLPPPRCPACAPGPRSHASRRAAQP